jgi:adenine-specific DNA-methyltransferase
MEWNEVQLEWEILESPRSDEEVVLPHNERGEELRWKWRVESMRAEIEHFESKPDKFGKTGIYMKSRMKDEGMLPVTWWDKKEYSAAEYGTNLLTKMFGRLADFSFPKSASSCHRFAPLHKSCSERHCDGFLWRFRNHRPRGSSTQPRRWGESTIHSR